MQNIYVIGCGGIGCYILERLPMVISSLTLDLMSKTAGEQAYVNLGKQTLRQLVDRLVLIDGDRFNIRNAVRQRAGAGDKVVQRMLMLKKQISQYQDAAAKTQAAADALKRLKAAAEDPALAGLPRAVSILNETQGLSDELLKEMNSDMIRVTALQKMRIVGARRYITPDNIAALIPRTLDSDVDYADWLVVEAQRRDAGLPSLNNTIVFLCVDNKKTRYEVQKYMEKFDDCLLINGGNDKTTGQVNVYEKCRGKAFDPALYEVYPDITANADKRPDEVECGAVAPKHDQIAITNSMIANLMLSWYVKWARQGLFFVDRKGSEGKRYNEILLDIEKPTVVPLFHPKS